VKILALSFFIALNKEREMTTTVKISAHCASDKEVRIELTNGAEAPITTIIQDGETQELYVYDLRAVKVYETMKTKAA
jgi:hypothetical protein